MTTLFVTRHQGAKEWAARQDFRDVEMIEHLGAGMIAGLARGDIVIGTLPVHVAAQIVSNGGRYFHLEMTIPFEARGRDLSAAEMVQFGATLNEYHVERLD